MSAFMLTLPVTTAPKHSILLLVGRLLKKFLEHTQTQFYQLREKCEKLKFKNQKVRFVETIIHVVYF